MKNKLVALITGANRGIGLETSRQLGKMGYSVIIAARESEDGKAAASLLRAEGIDSYSVALDTTNETKIKAAVEFATQEFGKLDALINNAGVMLEGDAMEATKNLNPVSMVSDKLLRDTFEVNFFGVLKVTQAFLPLLKKSSAGRIVNVSSFLGSLTLQSDKKAPIYPVKTFSYNTSKMAVNSLTVHLAYELRDTPIKVNSADPGWVKTAIGGSAAPMSVEDGAKTSVQLATLPSDGPTGGFFHLGDRMPW